MIRKFKFHQQFYTTKKMTKKIVDATATPGMVMAQKELLERPSKELLERPLKELLERPLKGAARGAFRRSC